MPSPIVLNVTNALAYAKTSGNPIAVADYGGAIASNADALAALDRKSVV